MSWHMDGHLIADDPHKQYAKKEEVGEILVYGASIPGTGNVWDDLNVADFTGEEYAGVDGCVATALSIKTNSLVTFGHNLVAYIWQGPQGVCVGLGGTYAAVAGDLAPIGTGDHSILANRDQTDSHPQAAVTDLVADQNAQDSRLSALEVHPPLTTNPHQVRHDQLTDITDPVDPHPQYQQKGVSMLLGGTTDNFTLNSSDSKLVNYSQSAQWHWPDDDDINAAAGEITIPEDGIYRHTFQIMGDQGNDTKEEWIELRLDISGGPDPGRTRADILDVTTDKTSGRSLKTTFSRPRYANEVVSLWMWASSGLGTFSVEATTFEIIKIADISELTP